MRIKRTLLFIALLSAAPAIAQAQTAKSKKIKDKKTVAAPVDSNAIPVIDIEENDYDMDEDGYSSVQSSGGLYSGGNDPFLFTSITLARYNFRQRAFNNSITLLNGIELVNFERRRGGFFQTGSLSDVTRNQSRTYGLSPSPYAFGGLTGSRYVDATAAGQRKGTSVTYTYNPRSYGNRIMATYNSGLMSNGWAYSVSGARKWIQENLRPGTFYDGYAFYGAVSKVVGRSQFNLTTFEAPTARGAAAIVTDEVYHLAGNNQYNGEWGYQNGKKRDARVYEVFQPVTVLNYTYKPNDRTRWNTAAGYEFGKSKRSDLDGYNAASPFGDYYKALPSYYLNPPDPSPAIAAAIKTRLENNPGQMQVQWDNLYNQNYANIETLKNSGGTPGNNITGRRSLYVVRDEVDDMKKMSFATNIERSVDEHITLSGGARYVSQNDQFYKQVTDLLGGDYFVNYNQFANQQNPGEYSYAQNDLDHPDRAIRKGDIYGYNVKTNVTDITAWGQSVFTYNKFDFFAAVKAGNNSFSREGLMRNGLFPDNSLGKTPALNFFNYEAKAGVTYKINLKNFVYVNALYSEQPPSLTNTYVSVRTRDYKIDNPATLKTKSVEGGYLLKTNKFNARISGYFTDLANLTNIRRFYNDDPSIQSFVNYVMKDASARSMGAEFSGRYKFDDSWSVTGFVSENSTFYTNNPLATVYQDNIPGITSVAHRVYIKNYYLPVGPQSVYSLGINYRSPNRWTGRVNVNYMDRNYVSINPDRRTQLALGLLPQNSPQWRSILAQEKLPSAYTIDLSAGKTLDMDHIFKGPDRRTQLVLNVGVVNALDDKNIKVYGQEQLRYDYTYRNVSKFPNKYDYAFGINFYVNLSLHF